MDNYILNYEPAGPYYGNTKAVRNGYNEAAGQDFTDALNEDGVFEFDKVAMGEDSGYANWLSSFDEDTETFDLDFQEIVNAGNVDVTTTTDKEDFQNYGVTPDQAKDWATSPTKIHNEAFKNLQQLAKEDETEFGKVYSELTPNFKLSYLHQAYNKGQIDKDAYSTAAASAYKEQSPDIDVFAANGKVYTFKYKDSNNPSFAVEVPLGTTSANKDNFYKTIGTPNTQTSDDFTKI